MVANETPYTLSNVPDTGTMNPVRPDSTAYGPVSAVYDALMAAVPHDIWLHRIEMECARRGKTPRSVMDIACGTGIVTELLSQHGYQPVVGIDLSPQMIQIARMKADAHHLTDKITYQVQNAATLDLKEARFDLAVSLFDSLNYITAPDDLSKAFVRIAHHLNPGALLAFDVNSLYALSHDLFTQTGTSGPLHHVWRAYWDRESRTCRVEMDFFLEDSVTGETREFHETHIQRAYTITELREMLEAAGFLNISVYGNYGERTPGPKSDRLLFVAEKPEA